MFDCLTSIDCDINTAEFSNFPDTSFQEATLSERSSASTGNSQAENASKSEALPDIKEGLAAYLRYVSRHAGLLKADEEFALATRTKQGDLGAKRQLTQANLRLVLNLARRYAAKHPAYERREISLMDLVQEGNLGLLKAVEKFKPQLGYRFSTYATWWIQQSVMKALNEANQSIRLPGHVSDSIQKLNRAKQKIQEQKGRAATNEELALALGCALKKILLLEQSSQRTLRLDGTSQFADGGSTSLMDSLMDENTAEAGEDLHREQALEWLHVALQENLNAREIDIIAKRYGLLASSERMTLEAVGQSYGVTRECIRQTEARALAKLRKSTLLSRLTE
jgi:RNA polymerase primary sigma factor